jgi:hypothetical protein
VKQNTKLEFNVQNLDFGKKLGNSAGGTFDSYWKEIRKLDGWVKEISDCKAPGRGNSVNLEGWAMQAWAMQRWVGFESRRLVWGPFVDYFWSRFRKLVRDHVEPDYFQNEYVVW